MAPITKDLHKSWFGESYAKLTDHIIRRRWWWLLGVILVTVFFGMQMQKVRFDNSSEIWFVEGHESLIAKDRFDAAFGNDELSFLLFTKEETPFTPANLRAMKALAEQFEEEVPYARKVTWLGNVERIRGKGKDSQEVLIEDFLPEIPDSQGAIDARLREALDEPFYVDKLISRDATVLTMTIELDSYPPKEEDVNPRFTVAKAVNQILEDPRYAGLKPYLAGSPHFSYEYEVLVKKDTVKLFLLALAVQALLLLWLGRGPRGVAVPLAITSLAVFWTMGAVGLMGFALNLLSIALPTMLICVGIGDSMHGIAAYYDHVDKGTPRKKSLRLAFKEVGGPIMLTSMTTAVGFLAFLTTHVRPYREMGVYVAVGVLFAYILTVILTPILYSFGKANPRGRGKRSGKKIGGDIFDRWLALTHRIVIKRPGLVALVFTLVMAVTFVGYLQMKVESNTSKLIFKSEPLRQTIDLVDERLGASFTMEYLINTKEPSGIKDPAFMAKLDELTTVAKEHSKVTNTSSVVDVIKQMRRALHGNDPAYYNLPETREAIAQYLFLYESSGGSTLDRQVGFTYDMARLSLKTKSLDTSESRKLHSDMRAKIHELFGEGQVEIVESGSMARYLAMNDILYEGQRNSFIAALLVITLVMVFVLHSFKLGLISMVPNVFPVFLTMGFMGLVGYYMDVITISFAAVIIGVAVDDTIHFFTRFKTEFGRIGNYKEALRETLSTVGRPITFTTMVLILGNAAFMMSCLLAFFKLGVLFGVAFLAAYLADIYFAAALILLLKPLGPEREQPENI
jgi:predicted RND superfamily exporter protein